MLISCPVPDILFGGARGGGKTDALIGDWLAHAGRYGKDAKGILFRRSMPELEEVQARMREIFTMLRAEYASQQRTWLMSNGATLKLRFLESDDDSDKYQGHQYTWTGFDEIGNYPNPAPIDKIRATLRSAAGVPVRFLATANPGGKGHDWIKERYILPAPPMTPFWSEAQKTQRIFIPSKLIDNRILLENDPGYADRLMGSGPSWLVRAWLDGDWNAKQEGGIFKLQWWQYWRDEPPELEMIIQSWDTAFKIGNENDCSVGQTWGLAKNGFYLLDCWSGRVEFPELKRMVQLHADKWHPREVLVEDKASGQSLIQELQRDSRLPIRAVKVDRDKVARAYAVTPLIESGKVYLPEGAPWLADFIEEMSLFPNGSHDDRVDSLTQALDHLANFPSRNGLGLFYFYEQTMGQPTKTAA